MFVPQDGERDPFAQKETKGRLYVNTLTFSCVFLVRTGDLSQRDEEFARSETEIYVTLFRNAASLSWGAA